MSPAYASEFAYALPGSRAGGVETVESLYFLERRVRNDGTSTYPVQVVSKPHQIIFRQLLHTLFVFPPMKRVIESVAKVRRRSVER